MLTRRGFFWSSAAALVAGRVSPAMAQGAADASVARRADVDESRSDKCQMTNVECQTFLAFSIWHSSFTLRK
jgi:hypothetical protein